VLSEQDAIIKDNLTVMVRIAFKSAVDQQLKHIWVDVKSDQLIDLK